jgi:hypothetical protein
VLVDRWDLRRTLLVTQVLAMFQSFALAYFTLTHRSTSRSCSGCTCSRAS